MEQPAKTVGEVFEPNTASMLEVSYDAVARGCATGASRGHAFVLGENRGLAEAVHAPLLARDGSTVLVLGGVFFF